MTSSTFYFGYGSNLWLDQMHLRCPSSAFMGVGRMMDFRWMISLRGYANVVSCDSSYHGVYGLIYKLTPADEAALDKNEGVPHVYTKENMTVGYWESSQYAEGRWKKVDVTTNGQAKSVLVYIDRLRVEDGKPKEEYVHRMNMGIADAISMGIPVNYIEDDMRPFIPISVSRDVESVALEQAKSFVDGR